MLQAKLDRTKPFEIVEKKPGIRYKQNETYFSCGGIAVSGRGVEKFREKRSFTVSMPSEGRIYEEHVELIPVDEEVEEEEVVEEQGDGKTFESEHVFKCDVCGKHFGSDRGLRMHTMRAHEELNVNDDLPAGS